VLTAYDTFRTGVDEFKRMTWSAGAYTRPLIGSTKAHFVGCVGCMIVPQSIRHGDTGRCDQNGLGRAETYTSVSPWWSACIFDEAHQLKNNKTKMYEAAMKLPRGRRFGLTGRGLHSSTSQLSLSRFWSLKPQQASTSQLNLRRFCWCDLRT
jgi:hypothetical protein